MGSVLLDRLIEKGYLFHTKQNNKQKLTVQQLEFAREDLPDGLSLLEAAKQVKPTVLLGLSACRGLFKEVRS